MIKKLQDNKYFKIAVFAVVLLIPVIYSFFYLKSYWDPYGHLEDITVGIVNLDLGKDGENKGNEFVKELKDSKTFNFVDVENSDEATKGLGNDDYYAVITIPSDFTETLNSAKTDDKKISTITYSPNKRKNYLASQILNSALKSVELKLESKVSREVTANLADSLKDVPDNLQKISDGADKLNNGADTLNNGLHELSNGITTLDNKYSEFNNGIQNAYNGSKGLTEGISQVNTGIDSLTQGSENLEAGISQVNAGAETLKSQGTTGITQLSNGIDQLNTGATTVDTGVQQYVAGTESLAAGVIKLDNTLDSLINYYKTQKQAAVQAGNLDAVTQAEITIQTLQSVKDKINTTDETTGSSLVGGAKTLAVKDETTNLTAGGKLKAGTSTLKAGTTELKNKTSGLSQITAGIDQLKAGLTQVGNGATALKTGSATLKAGNERVEVGASTLENGLKTLSDSSSQVKDALDTINSGAQTAAEGTQELKNGTDTFKSEIDKGIETAKNEIGKLDGLEKFVEDPIEFKEESYGEVDSYGVAFAPLFISIGLWVGALMCYVVLYYDQRHRFGILDHDNKDNKYKQNAIYLAIGAVDGIVTGLILKLALGYSVVSMPIYLGQCILVGLLFMEVIQFLIKNFGDFGKFIALIILVLQLAASGGTFPVETIDNGFKGFTSFLPMTYTIRAFKDVLIPTEHSLLGTNTIIIIGIFAALLVLQLVIDVVKDRVAKNNVEEVKKTKKAK